MKPEIITDPGHWKYMLRKVHHPLAFSGGLMKLNVASGWCAYDGFVNVDISDIPGVGQLDLFQFPWPWDDNTFDYILASEFLEHVPNDKIMGVIHNLGRVLKVGGVLEVMCPHPDTFKVLFQIPGHHRLVGEHNDIKREFTLEILDKKIMRGFRIGKYSEYHVRKYLHLEIGRKKTITMFITKEAGE